MFRRASQFAIALADLAEAEGRVLRSAGEAIVKRLLLWALAALVAGLAVLFVAFGVLWLLAWLVTWPVALILTGLLLAFGVWQLLRAASGPRTPAADKPPLASTGCPPADEAPAAAAPPLVVPPRPEPPASG